MSTEILDHQSGKDSFVIDDGQRACHQHMCAKSMHCNFGEYFGRCICNFWSEFRKEKKNITHLGKIPILDKKTCEITNLNFRAKMKLLKHFKSKIEILDKKLIMPQCVLPFLLRTMESSFFEF